MVSRHVAFGLDLRASFPLPGMEQDESGDGLPSLDLELSSDGQMPAAWSGCDGPPEWRGRLGDGLDLVIERGVEGDVLFSYGERAHFLLDESGKRLDCVVHVEGLDWQRAMLSKVLPSIAVMRGYEALHAAAVDSPEGVVAIMAPNGMGKSTLAFELLQRGWSLFADDVLTLERSRGSVLAHPGTPHMNLDGSTDPHATGDTLGILAGERWVRMHAITTRPRPVRLLCLLERGPGLKLEARPEPSNPLTLAPYMLGLSTEIERQRDRFGLYADLIESATLIRLTGGLEHRPEQLADLIEPALASRSEQDAQAIR
jgi:hypothetical protein